MKELIVNALTCLFFALACYSSYKDIKERRLPNVCLAAMLVVALVRDVVCETLRVYALQALVFCSVCVLIELFFRRLRKKQALGFGDIKLLVVWCVFSGAYVSLLGFSIGLFLGALVALFRKKHTFAAGPWINALSACVFLL